MANDLLAAAAGGGRQQPTVGGHRLTLSNLDKVLYPAAGTTKAAVIAYYAQIAPVLLPHVRDRPVTLRRFPEGVEGPSFFEKNAPRGRPSWLPTAPVPRRAGDGEPDIDYVLLCDEAGLVWVANMAALELHVPMWRAAPGVHAYGSSDLMVFDLDPGGPAGMVECCRVACWLRQALADEGYEAYPKTSGSKGLQLYVPLRPAVPGEDARDLAHRFARLAERALPGEVVSNMRKDLRRGKVLVDWSQNHPAKTTVAAYSLRARPRPTVSTPVHWREVEACEREGNADRLVFECDDVLRRVAATGDLFAPLVETGSG
ncbi:MAG: non-homologous end-joining DNA ligase [Acidimicrobiales bacterium]